MGFKYEFVPTKNKDGMSCGVFKGFTAKYPGAPVSLLFDLRGMEIHGPYSTLKVKCDGYFGTGGYIEKVLINMGWTPTPEEPYFTFQAFDRFVNDSIGCKYWLKLTRDEAGFQIVDYTTLSPIWLSYELIADRWYDNDQHWCLYSDGDVRITQFTDSSEDTHRYNQIPVERLWELLSQAHPNAFNAFVNRFNLILQGQHRADYRSSGSS